MSWLNPVPTGKISRGFGPSANYFDAPAFADSALTKAHDAGNGPFPGSIRYDHFHAALDLFDTWGSPIIAPQSGVVLDAKWGGPGTWADGGGWFIRVQINPTCMYLVAHCSQLHVVAGQKVNRGQLIARVGSTGIATGPHAHFWARLGPRLYYDNDAFYYNPRLILPGGDWAGDPRFEPQVTELPDTAPPPPSGVYPVDPLHFSVPLDAGRTFSVKAGVTLYNDEAMKRPRTKLAKAATFTVLAFGPGGIVLAGNPGNPDGHPFIVPANH